MFHWHGLIYNLEICFAGGYYQCRYQWKFAAYWKPYENSSKFLLSYLWNIKCHLHNKYLMNYKFSYFCDINFVFTLEEMFELNFPIFPHNHVQGIIDCTFFKSSVGHIQITCRNYEYLLCCTKKNQLLINSR